MIPSWLGLTPCTYVGIALPVIGPAALSSVTGTPWAVAVFGAVLSLVMAICARRVIAEWGIFRRFVA